MAVPPKINIEKSIIAKKLIYKRDWADIINAIGVIIILIPLAILSGVLFWLDMQVSKKLSVLVFTCIFIFILAVYSIYRTIMGSHLSHIHTGFQKNKNMDLVLAFVNKTNNSILLKNKNIIIINEENELSWNNVWSKTIIFIPDDNTIYFNIKKDYPKLNLPVLFSHLALKSELKNFIKKESLS